MPIDFRPSNPVNSIIIPGLSPDFMQEKALRFQRAEAERSRQHQMQMQQQQQAADMNNPLTQIKFQQLQNDLSLAPINAAKAQTDLDAAKVQLTTALAKQAEEKKWQEILPEGASPADKSAVQQYIQTYNAPPPTDASGKVDLAAMRAAAEAKAKLENTYSITEDVINPDGTVSKVHKQVDKATGQVVSSTAPGLDAAETMKRQKAAAEAEEAKKKAATAQSNMEAGASVVFANIDAARKIVAEGGQNPITGGKLPVTGWGSWLSIFPSKARDLQAHIDTIKARIGFDELQKLRNASPTGGALGQVSERELMFLQGTVANLDRAQSEEQFLSQLATIEAVYNDIIHKGIPDPDAWLAAHKTGTTGASTPAPTAPAAPAAPAAYEPVQYFYSPSQQKHYKKLPDGSIVPAPEKDSSVGAASATPSAPAQATAPASPANLAGIPIAPIQEPFAPEQRFSPRPATSNFSPASVSFTPRPGPPITLAPRPKWQPQ